ncbi:MAG: T9SS type A sorting domain-containing protein [Bacteroidetes bacterium]|nr:T9SS type A sorting domain-containing protein [Bacteroidota bacterium]
MKTILYALVMSVIFAIPAIGQTQMEPPSVSYYNGTAIVDSLWSGIPGYGYIQLGTVNINFDDTTIYSRKQKNFALGYQWGLGWPGLNKRLGINLLNNWFDYFETADSLYAKLPADTARPMYVSWGRVAFLGKHPTLSMQFDPEAPLYAANGSFTPRTGDTSGATFGFKFREMTVGSVISNPSDVNFNRYILKKDNIGGDTINGRMVLRYPEKNNTISMLATSLSKPNVSDTNTVDTNRRYYPYSQYQSDSINYETQENISGHRWYLTLNLRRLDNLDLMSTTDTVLTIKLPYWKFPVFDSVFEYNADSAKYIWRYFNNIHPSTIRFDSVFMQSSGTLDTVRTSRGLMDNHLTADTHRVFVIRKNMLPRWKSDGSHDITISAFFRLIHPDSTNAYLRYMYGGGTPSQIDSLGIEVKYFGRTNIAIDWIRFETPDARALFRGNLDVELAEALMYEQEVLKQRNAMTHRKVRISTFYHFDECGGIPSLWRGVRYNTKMLEGMNISEGAGSADYVHVTGQNTLWGNTPHTALQVHVPYSRYGGTWGYECGWDGTSSVDGTDSYRLLDSANGIGNYSGSAYELYSSTGGTNNVNSSIKWCCSIKGIWDHWNYNDTNNPYRDFNAKYDVLAGAAHGPLMTYDVGMNYMHKYNQEMLYGYRPWWSNFWVLSGWVTRWDSTLQKMQIQDSRYDRPQTGEEFRENAWTALILRAKGLMYDRFYYGPKLVDVNDTTVSTAPNDTIRNLRQIEKDRYRTDGNYGHLGVTGGYIGLPDSIVRGTDNGEVLLRSEAAGSDWLHRGDYSLIDKYCNIDSIAVGQGVDTNHIYLGRKSVRLEVLKIHDRIETIGDTLMRLRLMGWLGKGFRTLISAKDNDTSYLTKFIKIDSAEFKMRPFWRSFADGYDSTFFDATILKDTSISMNSVFYVGVLNRRTNPLMRLCDTCDLQFFTTAEFDSLTTYGDSVWKSRRYKQGGSRELSLPFNYKDSNGRYALLHIKELGGGIDTIIGQDRTASIKLLPGEGKIFKVQILRPNEVAGELAFSNQTKIVAYPKMSHTTGKWLETDTIVHYMTYHKRIHSDTNGLTGVYFRKSKPATKYMNTAAIQWEEPEYLLSYSVYHNNAEFIDCDTCAYPSIVTRFDSVSQEYRSFVVYGCTSDYKSHPPTPEDYQYIVESMVRVRNDSVIGNYQGRTLAIAAKRDMAEWGTPMISAADSVNFYCWSDAYSGIMASWKKPDIGQFTDAPLNIHWSGACYGFHSAQHPSMTPYNRYLRGEQENECGLVWQENNGCGGTSRIFYTRLRLQDGYLVKSLAPHYQGTATDISFNTPDSNILFVSSPSIYSTSYRQHTFPVVNRDLYLAYTDTTICNINAYFPGYTSPDFKFDRVYWMNQIFIDVPWYASTIDSRLIMFQDTTITDTTANKIFVPRYFEIGDKSSLWDANGKFIDQPVVSAGEASNYHDYSGYGATFSHCFNYDQRAINLNFRSRPVSFGTILIDTLATIVHFPQMLVDDATSQYVSIVDIGSLSYPHLAQRGSIDTNDWQRNHRIYNRRENHEVVPAPLPTIRSSGQYFFRTTATEPKARQFYGYGDDSLSFGVSSVIIGEHEYHLKVKPKTSPLDFIKPPDTLSTDWFNIDNFETMDVITTGSSPDRMSVWLERESDGATYDVPLTAGERMKINRETVELINGDDENYRVRICSHNNTPYHPETAITDDNEEIGLGKSSGKNYKQINLGQTSPSQTIFIYPNPAREEVNLTIKGDKRSEVIIVSAVGGEATRFFTEGGKTVTVNTSTFPSGVYVVRVRRDGIADAVVPFVIVR